MKRTIVGDYIERVVCAEPFIFFYHGTVSRRKTTGNKEIDILDSFVNPVRLIRHFHFYEWKDFRKRQDCGVQQSSLHCHRNEKRARGGKNVKKT